MIKLRSFAKINLGLEITGKREDGFHFLKTIFQTVSLHDSIEIKKNNTKKISLNGNNKSVQWDDTNSIMKAIKIIYGNFNLSQGFDIFVSKNIKPGSGLGGGSSNAAVIIMFLENYFSLSLKNREKIEIAKSIGADVPFFLFGGTMLGEGIGEILTSVKELEEQKIAIISPEIEVSTKLIFSSFNLTTKPRKSKIDTFLGSGDISILKNELETTTFDLFPELKEIKEKMVNLKLKPVLMSGSGSSIYCFPEKEHIAPLRTKFPNITISKTLNRKEYFKNIGAWPSGKASVFGADIRRFESSRPRKDK